MRRIVAILLLIWMISTGVQAYSLVSIYDDLKTDFPEFTARMIDGGATEAEIEAFLMDLGQTVQSYGELTPSNFESMMYQALKEVLFIDGNMAMIREEHFNFTVALLFEFNDEITQTLETKTLSGDLALLSEAVERALVTLPQVMPAVTEMPPLDLGTIEGAGLDETTLVERAEAVVEAEGSELVLDFTGTTEMVLPPLENVFSLLEEVIVGGDDATLYLTPETLLPGLERLSVTLAVDNSEAGEYQLSMQVGEMPISSFNRPLKVGLDYELPQGVDSGHLSVLYVTPEGTNENMGGYYRDGMMLFETRHFSTFRVTEIESGFGDVPVDHFAYMKIESLAAKGIISGKGDGGFDPEAPITRAETAALISRMLKLTRQNEAMPFVDVAPGKWYTEEVLAAYDTGLIAGRGEGIFDPLGMITRQEVLAILSRALKGRGYEDVAYETVERPFEETQIDGWAKTDVGLAIDRGLMVGLPAERCIPVGMATRSEVANMIYEMLDDLY